ncbi:MAG: dihydrodipicolinate synthase family protein [Candidatus Aminicenantes bacterium]|nr:dihydrodipicolinate synthase family protein [Candidatus Aminicenantes bacterium]
MEQIELRGTIVPLVTPFNDDESVNLPALEQLIDYILYQGADGLISTALTGEGPQLKDDEITDVWDVVFQKAKHKLPVIPAVISHTTARAVHLVSIAEEKGAAAVMVAPILNEIYVERSHRDIIGFYKDIAGSTSLPIILFNYPSLTSVDIVPSLATRLVEIENIRYIKESIGDVRRVHEIERLTGKSLSVICGAPNTALECFALGCRTWITGILNNVPRSARQLMQAVHDLGDLGLARRIYYNQILPVVDVLQDNNNSLGTIKTGVSIRGVDVGPPRRPGRPIEEKDRMRLEQLFKNIDENEVQIAKEIAKKGFDI